MSDIDVLPFVSMPGISFQQRGKQGPQTFAIAGVRVEFVLGDMNDQNDVSAVVVPHSARNPSKRSVMGHFKRSPYAAATEAYEKIFNAAKDETQSDTPFAYGQIIVTDIPDNAHKSDFGKPSYFFNAITVTGRDENDVQFNAVRAAVKNAGWAAYGISDGEKQVKQVMLPALGTGPAGHLKGYQSARAIFAGIHDFGTNFDGDAGQHVEYKIVIRNDAAHAPMIDEFVEVMNDCSYLVVPPAGEIGEKKIDDERYLDHILLEDKLTDAYRTMQAYQKDYPRYDM